MVIVFYNKITYALFNLQFMKTVIKSICMYVMIFLPKSLGTRIIFTCLYEDLIFPVGSEGKESTCNPGDRYSIPGSGRSPDKGMATHSSILTWRIPWTEEPGGL